MDTSTLDSPQLSLDLLVFTIYMIVTTYILYQAYKSLENKVVIAPDMDYINQQLEEYEIKDLIAISFKFAGSYALPDLTKIPIVIQNKSQDDSIHVDWDECTITNFANVSARVIRIISGITDIPQKQAIEKIAPNRKITENLNDDKSGTGPLFKPRSLKKAAAKGDPFLLRLYFRKVNLAGQTTPYAIQCRFMPKKLRLKRAITLAFKPRK
ncbi:MAG: hypothetical protein WBG73_23400 [Coleofasciculaceae cyanobacterium]